MKQPSIVYLVLCLWCWAPLAQLRAIPLSVFLGGSPPSASFTAYAAGFDGNDVIKRTTAPSNLADGAVFTVSMFLDPTGGDATLQNIYWCGSSRLEIRKTTGNAYQIVALNSSGTTILDATTSVTKTAANGWFHLYICIDLTNSSNRKIYFDGIADASVTWTVYTNGTIDMLTGSASYKIGGGNSDLNKMHASIAEFWFNDSYLDSPSSFATGATPKSLGADGSLPGVAPVWYLSLDGSGNLWMGDSSANNNDFDTIVGALGSPTAP